MSGADLHVHSTASDGRFAPREVMRRAFGCDLAAVALTDHDTVAGLPEAAREAHRLGLRFVPACEVSVMAGQLEVHVLAFGIDPTDAGLHALLSQLQAARGIRVREMLGRLSALGVPLRLQDVLAEARGSHALGRAHVARAMRRQGRIASLSEAFEGYIGDGRPACVPKQTPAPEEVLRVIRAAGGAAVIAHPQLYRLADIEGFFADWDIAGVEVGHPRHSDAGRAELEAWAARRGLVATAGSDWHGEEDPGSYLGCQRCELSVLERLTGVGIGRGEG